MEVQITSEYHKITHEGGEGESAEKKLCPTVIACFAEIEEEVSVPTEETKKKHRDVCYNRHAHLAGTNWEVICRSDDGELLGIVGRFTSDASSGVGTHNVVTAAIRHPGGASSGIGGSAWVHLGVA